MKTYRLNKREKLCRALDIDALFGGGEGSLSAIAYPLRAAWRQSPSRREGDDRARFLVSVPKKRLRRAVDRVAMRRRVREAYRLNHAAAETAGSAAPVDIAFVYVADALVPYAKVESAMRRLLSKIHKPAEKSAESQDNN